MGLREVTTLAGELASFDDAQGEAWPIGEVGVEILFRTPRGRWIHYDWVEREYREITEEDAFWLFVKRGIEIPESLEHLIQVFDIDQAEEVSEEFGFDEDDTDEPEEFSFDDIGRTEEVSGPDRTKRREPIFLRQRAMAQTPEPASNGGPHRNGTPQPEPPKGEPTEVIRDTATHERETEGKPDEQTPALVNLDQIAAIAHKSKKTLERYRKNMPTPVVQGHQGKGRASLWDWTTVRPWIMETFGIPLPEVFP